MATLTDEQHVARNWVERIYPEIRGTEKARLIVAFGAGADRGLAEAREIWAEFRGSLLKMTEGDDGDAG
jgi:hypothetical protein